MCDLLVLSACEEELSFLDGLLGTPELVPMSPIRVRRYLWKGRSFIAAVTGPGCISLSLSLGLIMAKMRPKKAFLVGTAGAMPDCGLRIGDVVISVEECLWEVMGIGGIANLDPVVQNMPERMESPPLSKIIGAMWDLRQVRMLTSLLPSKDIGEARFRQEVCGVEAENMEGYAFFWILKKLGIDGAEIRAISNTAGERDKGKWDMEKAMNGLKALFEEFLTGGNVFEA